MNVTGRLGARNGAGRAIWNDEGDLAQVISPRGNLITDYRYGNA